MPKLRTLPPAYAFDIWSTTMTPSRSVDGTSPVWTVGEFDLRHGTTPTGRARCLVCGERIAEGSTVIVSREFCGGFNQWSKRYMHSTPCVELPPKVKA